MPALVEDMLAPVYHGLLDQVLSPYGLVLNAPRWDPCAGADRDLHEDSICGSDRIMDRDGLHGWLAEIGGG